MTKDRNVAAKKTAGKKALTMRRELGEGSVLLLGATTALGSLGIQMFVPALPFAALALGTDRQGIQLAIGLYLVVLGIGQLPSGAAADAWGTLKILRAGLILFILGSTIAAFAQDLPFLLAGRALQAAGAAAGMVTGRALSMQGKQGARDIAILQATVLISPSVAPLLGGLVAEDFGWRAIFVMLAAGGVLLLVISLLLVEKWHPLPSDGESARKGSWLAVVASPGLGWNAAMAAITSFGLYSFLSIAPAVLGQHFGETPSDVGLWLGLIALCAAAGAVWSSRMSSKMPSLAIKRQGCSIVGISSVLGLVAYLLPFEHPLLLVMPMAIYTFGTGLILPNSTLEAMQSSPSWPARAVGLYGLAHMGGGALAAVGTSFLPATQPILFALLLVPGCILPLMALRRL